MKNLFLTVVAVLLLAGCNNGTKYKMVDGTIFCQVPERAAGQSDMIAFAAEPIDTVRVGFIGLGMRGPGAVRRWCQIEGTKVVALCDINQSGIDKSQRYLAAAGREKAAEYLGPDSWKSLCERADIDLVYIMTDWKNHAQMALYAMQCGKHTAIEVPAAMTIDEIWALIDTSERTRKHCIQLENCVYDRFEITALNMAQQGLFGEILHTEGAYVHCLDEFWSEYYDNWRLDYNLHHRGDVYPTHGIGPICQVLGIHRGDRMKSLVSLSSHSVSSNSVSGVEFSGTMNSALITTEKNKTILIQCCMTLPRPYSRSYMISGTKGYVQKYPVHSMSFAPDSDNIFIGEQCDSIIGRHRHPFVEKYAKRGKELCGKRWIDFAMDERLIYCLRNGLPLDMDVYDAAEWSSLVELTEQSALAGGAPVEIPDFTRGRWDVLKGIEFAE
jgi:predicted dehydrogenase